MERTTSGEPALSVIKRDPDANELNAFFME